jgi:hypothetical protein
MSKDPELLTHLEWLGYLQPVGLVVSPPALVSAQAFPAKNIIPAHSRFLEIVEEVRLDGQADPRPVIRDFPRFATQILGWEPTDIVGTEEGRPVPDTLEVSLPVYNETLRPTYAVPEYDKAAGAERRWLLLIQRIAVGLDLDATPETGSKDHRWQASPQARFERLLRETQIPIGLLSNDRQLRLVYAPRGETSGHLTFPVQAMTEVAGRPIFAALQMLLSSQRLFSMGDKQRLPAILAESRKYQNLVSTKLAEQVLAALYELLRGFQAADDQRHGDLLRAVLEKDANHVYAGLLTVLLRLVFLLYAEDRSLLSSDEVYQRFYSVTGLFERLREDAGRYTDTMDHRYGAWAQLLTLFRLIHDGGRHGGMQLPPRKGYLFDPDRYAFLEGRPKGSGRQPGTRADPPRVSDGVAFRVLQNLLILDGERLSYRTLDVEQIGSVYETMMGFNLEVAHGRSIAIKPAKAHGAPTTINLEDLLSIKPAERAKWLKAQSDQTLTGQAATALKDARTAEDAVAALEKKVARAATPNIVPAGAMVLQPSDERRRSGSHYTPRSLTEPIVRTTLGPISERLGSNATPQQVLDLKVCDPAMGSGAFLVEACRQLGDALVKAWHLHNQVPRIPPDEDEILHARRLIAQRCLYGVDKNPMAVDLSKLSVWLATLAKEHPFTFLDHALRHGDSLVGLKSKQIADFHWLSAPQRIFGQEVIEDRIKAATRVRQEIIEAGDEAPFLLKAQKLALAEEGLNLVRFAGNLVIAAFFTGDNDRQRKTKREELLQKLSAYLQTGNMALRPTTEEQDLRSGNKGVHPFHWEIEFPEVFGRLSGGFNAVIGNPPFLGGTRISAELGMAYFAWLTSMFPPAGHLCDQVAYFFRMAYSLLARESALGLLATNTIAQGDTREGGLQQIVKSGGIIYSATRRYRWPGQAAVIVSVVHVFKGQPPTQPVLNGVTVKRISPFLLAGTVDESPARLKDCPYFSLGSKIYGQGFIFDNADAKANPIALMNELLTVEPQARTRIYPYIGGEEVNTTWTFSPERFVIYLSDIESEAELQKWPVLTAIVREKVKPERDALGNNPNNVPLKRRWWAYQAHRPELYNAMKNTKRVLVCSQVSAHFAFCFLPTGWIYSQKLCLFVLERYSEFALIQSRTHEIWTRFFASTLKDDLNYTPSDCFETFPFCENFGTDEKLEAVGKEYYEFRAALMVKNNEGLTKTYNRFHDPNQTSPDIKRLRELHAAMDRAVLDAYGWTDLKPACEFLLDYEEEEDDDADDRPAARGRKKPWRYRWPDEFRDTVLARLLELNKQRAEEDRLRGAAAEAKVKKPRKTTKKASHTGQEGKF